MRALLHTIPDSVKHLLDALSLTALLGTLASLLPAFASLLTIVWTAIRIFETRTVQHWLGRTRESRPTEQPQ